MLRQIRATIDTWKECEYVIEHNIDGVHLKPLRVDNLSKHIFDYGDKNLLMSATIIDPNNFASARVLEKNGFRKEGHFIEDFFWNNTFLDSVHYGLLKKEFKK